MNGIQELFDFDTAIEDAFTVLFIDANLRTYSPRLSVEFQKDRPRIELIFRSDTAKKSYGPKNNDGDFTKFNATWSGTLTIDVVTASGDSTGEDSSQVHREYRAAIRYWTQWARPSMGINPLDGINGTRPAGLDPIQLGGRLISSGDSYLPFHKVQNIVETGNVPVYKTDQGYEKSTLTYAIDFGIDAGAWSELANNP